MAFFHYFELWRIQKQTSEATKAELFEIAGAFAKLASTPNGPGAAEVYEEVEATLGNVTQMTRRYSDFWSARLR